MSLQLFFHPEDVCWKDTKVVQLLYSIRKTLVLIIDFRIGIMLYINYTLRKEAYTNGQIMESEIA